MKAVVTVKLPKNPRHDPRNKQSGWCPINRRNYCTDVTGSHHSYVEEGLNRQEIEIKVKNKFKHITRIEYFDEEGAGEQK